MHTKMVPKCFTMAMLVKNHEIKMMMEICSNDLLKAVGKVFLVKIG